MENYRKGKNVEEELSKEHIPIEILPENFLWMHVKGGTKVANVIEYAQNALKSGECSSIVWSGSGGGVQKTISCAEIMKRDFNLHQVTRLAYQKIEEYWDPVLKGLDQIVVTRRVPAIHILLTLNEIDSNTSGYQTTNVPTKFWPVPKSREDNSDYVFRQKRNNGNNHRGGSAGGGRGRGNQHRHKFQARGGGVAESAGASSQSRNSNNNRKTGEGKMDIS